MAEENVQMKALGDVIVEQIENTVLEADKEPLREELDRHSEAHKQLKAAVAEAKNEQVEAMATIFATSVQYSADREYSGAVVKPIWLFTTM